MYIGKLAKDIARLALVSSVAISLLTRVHSLL